jgi:S-adenosylmethionine hydrolase
MPPIITLLSDFGTADTYVAAMKGVILSIQPEARIVDLTHEIPPHDIRSASFALLSCFHHFPRGSIHIAVVDPGVGGARRPILLCTPEHYFIGPDNGVFTGIQKTQEIRGCHALTASHYMLEQVSPTFHGRDIFAPAAAWLSRGVAPHSFGDPVEDPVTLDLPKARLVDERAVRAVVIHIDRFGNVVLALTRQELERAFERTGRTQLRLAPATGAWEVTELRQTYEGAAEGRPFFIFGSTGYLEISLDRASAGEMTGLTAGAEVTIELR